MCYRGGMHFTYRISEEDFIRAHAIPVRRKQWLPKKRAQYLYLLIVTMFTASAVWVSILLVGGKLYPSADNKTPVLSADAFVLSLCIALFFSALQGQLLPKLAPWLNGAKQRQLESYRSNPACGKDCEVTIDSELVSFEGEGYLHQSRWNAYVLWIWKDDLLLLVTHGGIRYTLVTRSLADPEKEQLRVLLNTVLPTSQP